MSEYSQIMDARDYLINNILLPLHPNIKPLPTLLGVCTQVDNAAAEILRLRSELADARRAGWIAGRDAAAEAVEKRACELDDKMCCNNPRGDREPECCGDPLYMISNEEAARTIRNMEPPK